MPFFPKDFGFTAAKVRRSQGHAVVVITGGKAKVCPEGYASGTGNDHRRRCHAEKVGPAFDFPPPLQGTVAAEDDGLSFAFEGIQNVRKGCDIDILFRHQLRPIPAVDTGVDVALLGVDQGAYPIGCADKIIGQADGGRDPDDGDIPSKGKSLGRRKTDTKARKRAGADGNATPSI